MLIRGEIESMRQAKRKKKQEAMQRAKELKKKKQAKKKSHIGWKKLKGKAAKKFSLLGSLKTN